MALGPVEKIIAPQSLLQPNSALGAQRSVNMLGQLIPVLVGVAGGI